MTILFRHCEAQHPHREHIDGFPVVISGIADEADQASVDEGNRPLVGYADHTRFDHPDRVLETALRHAAERAALADRD